MRGPCALYEPLTGFVSEVGFRAVENMDVFVRASRDGFTASLKATCGASPGANDCADAGFGGRAFQPVNATAKKARANNSAAMLMMRARNIIRTPCCLWNAL